MGHHDQGIEGKWQTQALSGRAGFFDEAMRFYRAEPQTLMLRYAS
jgi:hypothetical protein